MRDGLHGIASQTGESCKQSFAGSKGHGPSRLALRCSSTSVAACRGRNERTLGNSRSCKSRFLGHGAKSLNWGTAKAQSRVGRGGALGASCDMSVLPDVIQGLSDLPHNLALLPHLTLGVGVGLPCTVMDCGDVIYRSTLPKPSALQLTYGGVTLLSLIAAYLWATPGVAPGFWDMFILSPLEGFIRPKYTQVSSAVVSVHLCQKGASSGIGQVPVSFFLLMVCCFWCPLWTSRKKGSWDRGLTTGNWCRVQRLDTEQQYSLLYCGILQNSLTLSGFLFCAGILIQHFTQLIQKPTM